MANSQIKPWNNLWADLSQGMANSQIKPWNNLWADLSQGTADSQLKLELRCLVLQKKTSNPPKETQQTLLTWCKSNNQTQDPRIPQ